MSGSPLIGRIFTGTEKWRSVEQARLVVTADPHGSIGSLHLAEDGVAELVRFGRTRISAKEWAADAQIKDNARSRIEIRFKNGSRTFCARGKPFLYFFAAWRRAQTAGIAKRILCESWMNRAKPLERFPSGGLTDGHVRIVGDDRFTMRGIRDADGQPHPDEGVEKTDLRLLEGKNMVIAADDSARSTERVSLAKDGVRGGNGNLRNGQTVVHISEIDHADYFSRLRPGRTDQHVVIVGIAIDDAAAQRRKCRNHVRFIQPKKSLDERAPTGIVNVAEVRSNPTGAREVPFQLPMRGRMRKIRQSGIHLTEKLAEAV